MPSDAPSSSQAPSASNVARLDFIAPPGQAQRDCDQLTFRRGRLSSQTATLDLDELRYAFLFLPSEFKWHFLTPSETQYNYINLDALSDERFGELQAALAQQNPMRLGLYEYLLADYSGQVFKVSAKALRDVGVEMMSWLAEHRAARRERLARWVAAGSSITVGAHWFSFRGDINLSADGVRGGSRFLPWGGLGETKLATTRSLADVSFFHFVPVKESGYKGLSTGVPPKQIETMIAEINFWRAQNNAQTTATTEAARPVAVSPATDPLALVSIISGLLICIPGVGAIAAITGYLARKRIRASGGQRGGMGIATLGMILGIIQVAILLIIAGFSLGGALSQANKPAARLTPTRVLVVTAAPKAITARATDTAAPARTPTKPAAAQLSATAPQQVMQTSTAVARMQQATSTAMSLSYEATSQAIKAQSTAQSGVAEATAQAIRARNTVQTSQQGTATAQWNQAVGTAQAIQARAPSAQATLVARARWPLKLLDTFDSNVNGWPVGARSESVASSSQSLSGGKYLWEITAVQPVSSNSPTLSSVSSDLFLSVEIRGINTPQTTYCGLAFRIVDSNNQYIAAILGDQYFGAFGVVNGELVPLVLWMPHAAIQPGKPNRIAVIAEGSHMMFFVNDQFLSEADDSSLKSGAVGLIMGLSKAGDRGSYEFDNFELRTP